MHIVLQNHEALKNQNKLESIQCKEYRFIHVVKDVYVDKIIGCGIDKGSWELPIDSDNLFTQALYSHR